MTATVRRTFLWIATAAWAGVIFYLSSLPGSKLPGRIPPELGHFGEYFVFGALLYLALSIDLPGRQALLLAVLVASAYGVSDEFHQRFVVLRTPDVLDWVTDTIGALAGAGTAHLVRQSVGRRTSAARAATGQRRS